MQLEPVLKSACHGTGVVELVIIKSAMDRDGREGGGGLGESLIYLSTPWS